MLALRKLSVALIPLASAQFYTYTYLGCAYSPSITALSTGQHYPTADNPSDCANACGAYRYMYVKPNPVVNNRGTVDCYCEGPLSSDPGSGDPVYLSEGYDIGTYSSPANSIPQWGCTDAQYTVSLLSTTFSFLGCLNPPPTVDPVGAVQPVPSAGATEPDANAAFKACAYSTYVLLIPLNTVGYITGCGNPTSYSGGTAVPCDNLNIRVYTHDALSATGGLTRRKTLSRSRALGLCPRGLQACLVREGASDDEFECLDTSNELESCGGCAYGSPSIAGNGTRGIDCTAMPGVAMTAITCSRGLCQAEGCEDGFVLKDGICFPI